MQKLADTPADLSHMVAKLRSDDESVLGDILEQLGPFISARLKSTFSLTQQDVEDILSKAVFRLWENRKSYDIKISRLTTYIWVIARRVAIDFYNSNQQRSRRRERGSDLAVLAEYFGACKSGEKPTSKAMQDLWDILCKYSPENQKIILTWADREGKGKWAAELAEEIQLPAGVIRVRRTRIFREICNEMRSRGYVIDAE